MERLVVGVYGGTGRLGQSTVQAFALGARSLHGFGDPLSQIRIGSRVEDRAKKAAGRVLELEGVPDDLQVIGVSNSDVCKGADVLLVMPKVDALCGGLPEDLFVGLEGGTVVVSTAVPVGFGKDGCFPIDIGAPTVWEKLREALSSETACLSSLLTVPHIGVGKTAEGGERVLNLLVGSSDGDDYMLAQHALKTIPNMETLWIESISAAAYERLAILLIQEGVRRHQLLTLVLSALPASGKDKKLLERALERADFLALEAAVSEVFGRKTFLGVAPM